MEACRLPVTGLRADFCGFSQGAGYGKAACRLSCAGSKVKAGSLLKAFSGRLFVGLAAAKRNAGPRSDLGEFISQGPLVTKLGEDVVEDVEEWQELGGELCGHLGFDPFRLSEAERSRIYHYYIPVFLWCKQQLFLHRASCQDADSIPPLVIGISAPQGCGKTTIVDALQYLFNVSGSNAAAISIDDFYLTAAQQTKLAGQFEGNKLLELRGNAGSHDLELGTETLKALKSVMKEGTTALCPRYDKSARNGRGDRGHPSTWPEVKGPLAVILFEGWMLGFEPQDEAAVTAVDPQLGVVNRHLAAYHQAWHSFIDSWIIIQVGDPSWVFTWRQEAEVAMRNRGKPGMSDSEVEDFVSRYMPAYKAYLPALYSQGPRGAKPENTLKLEIDRARNPVR